MPLRTPKSRKWLKKLCCFDKIKNKGILSDLAELIPSESHLYNTRNTRNITIYSCKTNVLKYYFFPWRINEWNKLNLSFRASSFNIMEVNLIKIIRLIPNSIFGIFNPLGLDHKNLALIKLFESAHVLCTWSLNVESTVHFFLSKLPIIVLEYPS